MSELPEGKKVGEKPKPVSQPKPDDADLVFTPYITKNGKRIYHPTGGVFVFPRYTPKKMIN